ncbi:MAG: helix-turn-helix transcriptional regulator [Nitrospira sp.]|nr:helix-turn-helix transcriptional regulator [Nitrospira sp.]
MYDLKSRDLKLLTELLLIVYAADSRETYIHTILTGITSLIPCSYASYNEINLPAKEMFYKSHGIDQALYESTQPAFKAYLHQHPWGQRVLTTPDYGVRTLSDFMSDRAFHSLALYQEYYRHLGISRQLGVSLSVPPAVFIPIVINRDGRDFGSRERQILDVLRPHLTQAFQNATAWDRLNEHHSSLQRLFQRINKVVIQTDRRGKILWASSGVEDLFRRYRLLGPKPSPYLPSPVLDWLLKSIGRDDPQEMLLSSSKPLSLRTAHGTLTVRRLDVTKGVRLLFEDQPYHHVLDGMFASQLSTRELEVLQILAAGKGNKEIGLLLGISHRTVQKHLERIYTKLGVENRAAAAGRLWDLSNSDP